MVRRSYGGPSTDERTWGRVGVVEFGGEERIKSEYRVTLTTSASFVGKDGIGVYVDGQVGVCCRRRGRGMYLDLRLMMRIVGGMRRRWKESEHGG